MLDVCYPLPIINFKQGPTIPKRTDGLPSFWKKDAWEAQEFVTVTSWATVWYTPAFFFAWCTVLKQKWWGDPGNMDFNSKEVRPVETADFKKAPCWGWWHWVQRRFLALFLVGKWCVEIQASVRAKGRVTPKQLPLMIFGHTTLDYKLKLSILHLHGSSIFR